MSSVSPSIPVLSLALSRSVDYSHSSSLLLTHCDLSHSHLFQFSSTDYLHHSSSSLHSRHLLRFPHPISCATAIDFPSSDIPLTCAAVGRLERIENEIRPRLLIAQLIPCSADQHEDFHVLSSVQLPCLPLLLRFLPFFSSSERLEGILFIIPHSSSQPIIYVHLSFSLDNNEVSPLSVVISSFLPLFPHCWSSPATQITVGTPSNSLTFPLALGFLDGRLTVCEVKIQKKSSNEDNTGSAFTYHLSVFGESNFSFDGAISCLRWVDPPASSFSASDCLIGLSTGALFVLHDYSPSHVSSSFVPP
jgi:hypothetical protein